VRAVDVVLAERRVGFGDADESNLGVCGEVVKEALDVAVDEADDGYADGGWGLRGCVVRSEGEEERREEGKFGSDHIEMTNFIVSRQNASVEAAT
jgi:hypothetical protein